MNVDSMPIIAIDPGREKCGVAIVAGNGIVLRHKIIATVDVVETVREAMNGKAVSRVILGDATASQEVRKHLSAAFSEIELIIIAEKNSTLEARPLYWKDNPPQGWRRFFPLSLQVPPVPIDDYAAIVLAKRFQNMSAPAS